MIEGSAMDNDFRSDAHNRTVEDRRSGIDTRPESEKMLIGERRSGKDRRSEQRTIPDLRPSNQQLALFARRLRRALGSERAREFFGVARGEYDFSVHPDVLRTLEWIEDSAASGEKEAVQPANPEKISLRKVLP
jgi:hypothetical protein